MFQKYYVQNVVKIWYIHRHLKYVFSLNRKKTFNTYHKEISIINYDEIFSVKITIKGEVHS